MRTKNVYKKKLHAITKEIRHKVRTVVLGYEQIPGVDYTESYAPVVADQTVRTMLALSLFYYEAYKRIDEEWDIAKSLDVEAAFLNAYLEEEVYIEIPEYFNEYCESRGLEKPSEDDVFLLTMGQYGLVQVARAWVSRFTDILTHPDLGMHQCVTDPCLFMKHDENGKLVLMAIIYIDDAIYCGLKSETEKLREHVKRSVSITDIGDLDTHLGVDYVVKTDDLGIHFECSMNKYISECVSEFEEHVKKVCRNFACPGVPGSNLMKHEGSPVDQSGYRKFVGKLLFAVKKVLPDCANAVRELSMHLENPSEDTWKCIGRIMGYLKFNYRALKLRKPKAMRVGGFVDSDWASDRNDRRSTTSYLTLIGDTALVSWQSKKQKTVSLSSTEAELYAESNAAQDIQFENNMVMELTGEDPERPSVLKGDNMGAIFLAGNLAVSQRTKHIDIRTRYITDQVRNKELTVEHVRSEDNPADAGSKHCAMPTHVKHAETIYNGAFELVPSSGEGVAVSRTKSKSKR